MYSKKRRDQYRKTRRDYLGIVIMTIGCFVVISGLLLILIIGLLLMLVMVIIGSAILLIGGYLDSNVRVRYQRTLPPVDQPIIVPSDFESILDYTYPKKTKAPTEDIEPFSTYKHLSVPFANFWVRIGYLTKAFSKYLGIGLILTFVFSAIQFVNPVNVTRSLMYLILAFLLMVPLFFIFLLWLLLNSYIVREKAYLFPEGHPYQDKVLWNVRPGSMTCQRGPAKHQTRMDLEICHQVPRSWRGKRMGLILTYPLNFYGTSDFMNHFYIPSPIDLEDGGLLRISRLGLRFDSDVSDVYFRVHFISLFRYRVLMILWVVIIAMLMIWFLFFIFSPLILYLATLFGIPV
ncbi:MAG: hypothetical protein ACFE8O_06905 [Candidatus Hermodarchaeota archaeon]